jgi:pescadillo
VWDTINDEELKRPDLYAPGASLPPHLSPFVKSVPGQYDPTVPLEVQEPEGEALAAESDEELEEDEEEVDDDEEEDEDVNNNLFAQLDDKYGDMDVANSEDDEDEDDDHDNDDEDKESEFGGFSDDEAEDGLEDEAAQRQLELEAELKGTALKDKTVDPRIKAKQDKLKELARKRREEAEELERAKGMLPKKKRRLFETMVYSNNKKSAEAEKLRAKRRKIEKERAKGQA